MTERQLGKLEGQMETVLTSLAEIRQILKERCSPCKKEILDDAKLQSDLGDKKQRNWILLGVVVILLAVAGTFLQSFYNRTVAHTDSRKIQQTMQDEQKK